MRDKNPFGIDKDYVIKGRLLLGNYLDIDAKAQLLGDGDRLLEEVPFSYDEKAFVFIPLSRNIRWDVVRALVILIDLKYKIAVSHLPGGSGSYKISQTWRVNYGDKGIILEAGVLEDLGSSGEGKFAVSVDL